MPAALSQHDAAPPRALLDATALLRSAAEAVIAAAGIQLADEYQHRDGMPAQLAVLALPRLRGAGRAITVARQRCGDLPLLALVADSGELPGSGVVTALRAGADGIVALTAGAEGVRLATLAMLRGESVVPRGGLASVVQALRESEPAAHGRARLLSPRELLVLRRLADGRSTAEIAAELCITPSAVRAYSCRGVGKLRVEDLSAALTLVSAGP